MECILNNFSSLSRHKSIHDKVITVFQAIHNFIGFFYIKMHFSEMILTSMLLPGVRNAGRY